MVAMGMNDKEMTDFLPSWLMCSLQVRNFSDERFPRVACCNYTKRWMMG
jgi:hypothetical protein